MHWIEQNNITSKHFIWKHIRLILEQQSDYRNDCISGHFDR